MADYLVTDTELTSVANAIRTKGGTSANLSFPTEFVSAINAIGSGGLEYETGTYTPTADTAISTAINFSDTHSAPPAIVIIIEIDGTSTKRDSLLYGCIVRFDALLGDGYIDNKSTSRKNRGLMYRLLQYNATTTSTGTSPDYSTSGNSFSNFVKNVSFRFNTGSEYYRANTTYKWIAIWK